MKVENLMTTEPTTCSLGDSLATAAMKMWNDDCGILPVTDDGVLEGVITDRDIAMALGMKGVAASQVRVGEVITGRIFACASDDTLSDALEVMSEHKVRRLPVVQGGHLVGLVSLNDIVLEAGVTAGKDKKPTYAQVVKTLQAICEHQKLPVVV